MKLMQKSDSSKSKHQTKSRAIDIKKTYRLLIESYLRSQELAKTLDSQKRITENRVLEKAA